MKSEKGSEGGRSVGEEGGGGAGLYVSDPGGLSVPDTGQSAPTKLNVTPCPIPSLLSTSLASFN